MAWRLSWKKGGWLFLSTGKGFLKELFSKSFHPGTQALMLLALSHLRYRLARSAFTVISVSIAVASFIVLLQVNFLLALVLIAAATLSTFNASFSILYESQGLFDALIVYGASPMDLFNFFALDMSILSFLGFIVGTMASALVAPIYVSGVKVFHALLLALGLGLASCIYPSIRGFKYGLVKRRAWSEVGGVESLIMVNAKEFDDLVDYVTRKINERGDMVLLRYDKKATTTDEGILKEYVAKVRYIGRAAAEYSLMGDPKVVFAHDSSLPLFEVKIEASFKDETSRGFVSISAKLLSGSVIGERMTGHGALIFTGEKSVLARNMAYKIQSFAVEWRARSSGARALKSA